MRSDPEMNPLTILPKCVFTLHLIPVLTYLDALQKETLPAELSVFLQVCTYRDQSIFTEKEQIWEPCMISCFHLVKSVQQKRSTET